MRSSIKTVAVIFAVWTIMALLFAPQTYLLNYRGEDSLTWIESLASNLAVFYLWAFLTPLVWLLGKSLPIERPNQILSFSIIFILGFPIALLHLVLLKQTGQSLLGWIKIYQSPIPLSHLVIAMGASNIMIYWAIIIVSQADIYFRRYTEREQYLVKAQLQALKTQLHPHFLFNTLNAISELVYENREEAEKIVSRLGDLLRFSLKSEQTQEVTLRDELDFLRMYLEIQETLMQDRLKVIWRVLPDTLDAFIPNMILQPLVENSIRHGIAPLISGGTIKIIATQEDKWLTIRICDNGVGINAKNKKTKQFGIGVSNTKKRLQHLYGKDCEFKFASAESGKGTIVYLKIPFKQNKQVYENTHFNRGRYVIGEETSAAVSEQGF